jgi:hypothetical protein
MKSTFTVACICLKSVWQAVLLRAALATLLLAPLAALHATETTSKEPNAPLTTVASSTVTAAVSLDSPRAIGQLIFAARFDPLTGSVSVVPAAR